jgi:hypothetical protein
MVKSGMVVLTERENIDMTDTDVTLRMVILTERENIDMTDTDVTVN